MKKLKKTDFNKFESEKVENLSKIIGGDGSSSTLSTSTNSSSSTNTTGSESSSTWDTSIDINRIEMK